VDQDPGSGAFLPPGPGIRIQDEFFPDPGSKGYVFWWDFLKNPCSLIFLLIKLAPETIKSKKKKLVLFFIPIFMYSRIRDPRSVIRCFFIPRIRDKKVRDPDLGSGIKHPGSATLIYNLFLVS
jgi:hypothetical protein